MPDTEFDLCQVGSDEELAQVCAAWQHLEVLAIDTEFVRRRTFYPIAGLLQCYDGRQVVIIDPLDIADWEPLKQVLRNSAVLKVMHSCGEDLEVFCRLLDCLPAPLFDTQIAAGFCGMRPAMGYHGLVSELLQHDLPKDQTQSDWLARPLSREQLRYAAHDVYYLYAAYQLLAERLRGLGRFEWVLQESAALGTTLPTAVPPEDCYRRLKGAWRLSRRELAIARDLCAWRERQAREHDRPRNWIVKDATLLAIARQQPTSLSALAAIEGMPATTVRKQGEPLLQLVGEGRSVSAERLPPALPRPGAPAHKEWLAALRRGVEACAERLGIAAELVLSRRQQESLVSDWVGNGGGRLKLPAATAAPWRAELLQSVFSQVEGL